MKVFFTASFSGKEKYQRYYNMVLAAIEAHKVELISPEKGNYKELLPERVTYKLKDDKKIHYEAIKRGIFWADAVIIEMSHEDFQLGHESTLALEARKHVLCLSVHEDFSEKIQNRYFHGGRYNEYNVEELVENFITLSNKEFLSERFNCFLSPSQIQHLEKRSKEEGISASEYLRELIDKDR